MISVKPLAEASPIAPDSRSFRPTWTFLTNHAHVLICLSGNPRLLLRDVAERVGITERAVQRIVTDLEQAGALTRTREGRRNVYEVNRDLHLRHPVEADHTVGELLGSVGVPRTASARASRASLGR